MEDLDETDTVEVQESNSGSRKRRVTGGKRVAAKSAKYSRLHNSNVINFIYEGDDSYKILNKNSFTNNMLRRIETQTLPLRRSLTDEKKKDVDKLLQAVFGNWQELDDNRFNWYKELLFNAPTVAEEINKENECDCLDEAQCVRI